MLLPEKQAFKLQFKEIINQFKINVHIASNRKYFRKKDRNEKAKE